MNEISLSDKNLKLTAKRIQQLNLLGIYDAGSVLTYYPYRYDELIIKPFEQWKIKDKVTFEAEILTAVKSYRFGRNRSVSSFDAEVDDHVLHISIYNRPWLRSFQIGQKASITGIYGGGSKFTALNLNEKPLAEQEKMTPVYSVSASVPQRTVRACIQQVYEALEKEIHDIVPLQYRKKYLLVSRKQALRQIHFPCDSEEVKQAYRALKYEEFLQFFLSVEMIKKASVKEGMRKPRSFDENEVQRMISSLPYKLTSDQNAAIQSIESDLKKQTAMYRLVQGDVGCGKTAVAMAALYAIVLSGFQGVLLAPTEILAQQHFQTIQNVLKPLKVKVVLLHASMEAKEKQEVLKACAEGKADIAIGTHSLLQQGVVFNKLGLVIADEQQRFGVQQRRSIVEKGKHVDFLLMSATPIPRTLASLLYGDMDVSTIKTMPEGRKTVITKVIHENSFRSVLNEVEELLASGQQLYVICASVEKNEEYDARNVNDVYRNIAKLFAGRYAAAMLHGRMSSQQKKETMEAFADNRVQILVSTTVIEVGMNVINATGMIIYDADRFGMSQMHQLRGRVQRGKKQGYCWLLSGTKDEMAEKRLQVLEKTTDGFEISYEDLRLRGPGDILGTKQSGIPDFILGNVVTDTAIILTAKQDAHDILMHSEDPEFQAILQNVKSRNSRNASFID